MRTTVRLDDALLAEAKAYAVRHGRTLTSVLEEALRRTLTEQREPVESRRVELPVSGQRGGLQPGVDLDDSAALLDLMDDRAAS
jgi:hypothetical protein